MKTSVASFTPSVISSPLPESDELVSIISDVHLLVLLSDKTKYLRFKNYVKDHALGKESSEIFKAYDTYFAAYPSDDKIDWVKFSTYFMLTKTKVSADKQIIYRTILDNCKKAPTLLSSVPDDDVINYFVKLDYATQIVNFGVRASTDSSIALDGLREILDNYDRETGRLGKTKSPFASTKLSELQASTRGTGFEWYLDELNVSIGPITRGSFVVLAARPEVGKTTFLVSELTRMVRFAHCTELQERPIIILNNEEPSNRIMLRVVQSYFGITLEALEKDVTKYEEIYQKEVGNRILVISEDSGFNNIKSLDSLFREYNPCMIAFNMLDKVNGFNSEQRDDLRLGKLYWWARDKANQYGPVIALSQLDASAEGEKWITQDKLRGSKTDKASEADVIIGMGKVNNDPTLEHIRYLHMSKNKLPGGPKTKEEFRHGYFEVKIRPEIARFESHTVLPKTVSPIKGVK